MIKNAVVVFAIYIFWICSDTFLTDLFGESFLGIRILWLSAPYFIAIAFFLCLEKVFTKVSWREAFKAYGLRKPTTLSMQLSLLGILIVLGGYFLVSLKWPDSFQLSKNWSLLAGKFFLEAGLAEELVFRGYLFRKLRVSRSFLRAASFSGIIFGCTHLINFLGGVTLDVAIGVLISVVFGFLMTFPLALLFEISGGSIIAGVMLHFAIDSVNFFENLDGTPMLLCLVAAALAGLVVFGVGYRRLQVLEKSRL